MATNPQYAAVPKFEEITISTANTHRDGTGTIATLITGATAGTLIESILIKSQDATTAGMVRLFHKRGAGAWSLIREFPITAITPSATVQTFISENTLGFVLPAGDLLGVSTHNAESFNVVAIGGDF